MNGPLSQEQLRLVKIAMGDGSTWPMATTDYRVNHEMDRRLKLIGRWETLPEEEKTLYVEEAKLNDLSGGCLSLSGILATQE